ncbi:DUF3617 domain-containing protein [Sphingomonas sp.]|uniref:DUF3617 domain-containing protein n=1 Tax=Sphingomonas sp. TaxID=28214 RepID=UPI001ED2D5AE|nr:DUF3617 domain-containing protein [Sphingomonas sp.]MBX3595745.1 DUF3617 domain-containing protein [Sphingomonas sp.]
MRRTVIVTTAALALAACGGSEVSITNASPEEVAKKVDEAGGAGFKPGEWETTVETVSVDIPGLDGPMEEQMRQIMLKKKQVGRHCVTPEQAKSPSAEVLANSQGRCTYETFRMAGGKIDGTLVCASQEMGGKMTMRMSGSFTGTSFAIDNAMESPAPNGGPAMKITARTTGKRIGDCPAAKAATPAPAPAKTGG